MIENCEIYITGVRYNDSSWIEDPDYLLQQLYDNFIEINGFYFSSMSLNMAQVYNVTLKTSDYDSTILYLKGVRYKRNQYLDLSEVTELEGKIRSQINYMDGLEVMDIEFRCSKNYFDTDLGLYEIPISTHVNRTPLIIEDNRS